VEAVRDFLAKTFELINGKKTYLVAILFVIIAGLKAEGYISVDQYELVIGILGALGLASLRHGMSK
jgi:type IV secretory pathway VirB2 component (pilin)